MLLEAVLVLSSYSHHNRGTGAVCEGILVLVAGRFSGLVQSEVPKSSDPFKFGRRIILGWSPLNIYENTVCGCMLTFFKVYE